MPLSDEEIDDLADKVTDVIAEQEEQTPLINPFHGRQHIDEAINQVDLPEDVTQDDINKLREHVEMWLSDAKMEPSATVVFNGERRDVITPYSRPEDFDTEWHSTDPWRGYNEVVASDDWERIHTDTILSMHPSEKDLKELQERLRNEFKERGIDWVEVYPRTSNIFATGFDIFVKKGQKDEAKKAVVEAKDEIGMALSSKEKKMKAQLEEVT